MDSDIERTVDAMSEDCGLCNGPLNPYDEGIWKEVTGWVGGPKKDSMVGRHDTGRHAHNACIERLKAGQASDQAALDEMADELPVPPPPLAYGWREEL